MSPYKKNMLVGITVLVALVILGWMILMFSDAPFRALFAAEQIPVEFRASTAEGITDGSVVQYKGVTVGRVVRLRRSDDQTMAIIEAMVDQSPALPANVEGRIHTQLLGGGSSISLVLVPTEPLTGDAVAAEPAPQGQLKPHAVIPARFVGIDLLPPEFQMLAADLTRTSAEIRATVAEFRRSELIPKVVTMVDALQHDIEKAGKVVDSMQELVSDEQMRKDLRESLANFRAASASAVQVGQDLEKLSKNANQRLDEIAAGSNKVLNTANQRVDELGQELGERMTQVAVILENLEKTTRALNEGKGSAARFLHDPALYENLLDTSRQLNLVIADFERLVQQWEQEGVSFKLR